MKKISQLSKVFKEVDYLPGKTQCKLTLLRKVPMKLQDKVRTELQGMEKKYQCP